ncbi:DUF599 family protein [Stappia sp. F7233]|uniref:DUF599 family protein n=1 Tax=Stappia albiluteola TaxID=2758565 RepID=A0A839AGH2_9HYPH|nr:DUF599 family protein [Stappia albiluteola]MBA5777972.1 DUF599 family protein [Stappia albiluteola]
MDIFSSADYLALGWFLAAWLGFNAMIDLSPLKSATLSAAMDDHRRRWMTTMSERSVRIMDVGILGGLQQGTAFFASTALLAIGGCFAFLNSTERVLQIAGHLGLKASSAPVLWEAKVLGLTVIFAYAFFKFGWSYRLFNYTTILVGATPEATAETRENARLFAAEAGDLMVQAGRHFNRGQRALFFAIGYLGWFVDPRLFAVTTLAILLVLIRRQFFSRARSAALSAHQLPSSPSIFSVGTKIDTGSSNPFT